MKRLLPIIFLVVFPIAGRAADKPTADRDQVEIVEDDNAFAIELYGQLRNQPGNLFFSPMGISSSLAMTYAGARGDTAAEMAHVLHFTLPPEKLHPAMGALLHELNAVHDGYQLKVVNALWGQQGYTFLDDFVNAIKDNYGDGFNEVDFKGAPELARQTINRWVEQQTENKLKDLTAKSALTTDTRLVLTDAVYFKGAWERPFKRQYTKDEDFHVSSTQTVKTPLMQSTDEFRYLDGGTFQALEIPYKNRELSMVVFLPKDADGLGAFEQMLSADNMKRWRSLLHPGGDVAVVMPKFKIEAQLDLVSTLTRMGMRQPFGEGADFSEMDGNHDLFLSAVVHNAVVDVNEDGTEAAASTILDSTEGFPRVSFHADHPFLFLICEDKSGSILFLGRVTDPTK